MDSPPIPSWQDMVIACRRLEAINSLISLPDHQLKLLQFRPYYMAPGWEIPVHEHSFYEASIILSGSAVATYPQESLLITGSIYYHPPHSPHSWTAPTASCQRLIIWFATDPAVLMPHPTEWPSSPRLLKDCLELLQTLRGVQPGWRNIAVSQLSLILSQILAFGQLNTGEAEAPPPLGLAESVDVFLRDNLRRPIQLSDVATCFSISESSLTHRYRAETGVSVGQRLTSLRMEQAAHLLSSTDFTLEVIADQAGLTNAAYLCRLFRRYFHSSPGNYRRLNKY